MLAALRLATTCDEMEAAISMHTDASRLEEDVIVEINSICEKITFETTSKFRRRIKRFQEAIVEAKTKQESKGTQEVKTTKNVMVFVPIAESIVRLRNCKTWYDVETAMNTLAVPTVEDGDVQKTELKEALKEVMNHGNLATSKPLRRRISRLIFVLSNPEEKDEEKRAAKLRVQENIARVGSQPPTRSTRSDTRSNELMSTGNRSGSSSSSSAQHQHSVLEPIVLPLIDINAALMVCLSSLQQATKTADIDTAIALLPPTIADLVVHVESNLKKSFVDKLTALHEDSKLVSNAKLRRRIKRLMEMLLTLPAAQQRQEVYVSSVPVPVPAMDKTKQLSVAKITAPKKKRPLEPEEDVTSSRPAVSETGAAGSFVTSLAALNAASTPAEFESCLNDLTMESEGTDDERIVFRDRLYAVLEKDSCSEQQQDSNLIGNAKVRRKAKRLMDMLEARYPTTKPPTKEEVINKPVKEKKKKVPKVDLGNPPPGPPLDNAIQHVADMQAGLVTAEDLVGETAVLMAVDENSGNNRSRRSLKRALERVLADDVLSSAMQPRTRRKLSDIVVILTPKSNPLDTATVKQNE